LSLYDKIVDRQEKISVIGLGYVGLPIAVAFSSKADVIGYDINKEKITLYAKGIDLTNEIGSDTLKEAVITFTSDETALKMARFHIIAVPTPINADKTPDLTSIVEASKTVGRNLVNGSIVVYESTVYPGLTEEICIPILEQTSNLICGKDFKVGYSPERINPGDKEHRFENITKVVSGMDTETLDTVAKVYELVVSAGVYQAESIKIAEAAKVIENSQRDVNIAFMNELSVIFDRLGIDTSAVLNAAGTKWNFLNFKPGLVGGHCIGVDPYYLTYKAAQEGYSAQVILAGRRINDGMGKYIAENTIKQMIRAGNVIAKAKVAILGFTFKENCPDTRNTRVIDIVNELSEYGISSLIADPIADKNEAMLGYGVDIVDVNCVSNVDAVIIAVAHNEFCSLKEQDFNNMYADVANNARVLIDVKGILSGEKYSGLGYHYWRL